MLVFCAPTPLRGCGFFKQRCDCHICKAKELNKSKSKEKTNAKHAGIQKKIGGCATFQAHTGSPRPPGDGQTEKKPYPGQQDCASILPSDQSVYRLLGAHLLLLPY